MSRQRRKPMIVVLEVEVTTNTTHTNPLITKPLKWKKNEWLTSAEAWKVERRKQLSIFGKIGPNKKKKEKKNDLKLWKVKIMGKVRPITTNNKINIP